MRSLTSLHESRVHGPQNFRSPVQNDFCNKIGHEQKSRGRVSEASFGFRAARLEQLDEISGRVLQENLRAARSRHDLVAKVTPAPRSRATSALRSSTTK